MDSNTSRDLYRKILPGGKLDDKPIGQSDHDVTVQYIKKCFPKASKLQRNIEQTLKRTFVLEDKEKQRKHLTKKPQVLKTGSSRKQRLKKEKLVPKTLKFENFVKLNGMWKAYVADLLNDEVRKDEIQLKLNRIDLHGAYITVADANCKDYVGLEGIIVKETRNVFVIVTRSNTTRTVPKAENAFDISFEKPSGTLTICGNSFLTRPAERASKKIKSFMEFVGARVYKSKLRYTWPK
ncbi:unnamed protein product [Orchesella dallaii]|uniref:Ribonuclease P protein subunit p29 n=1 Tax=Orchesella dallaii TaxID=48710 RepID=A0ABP1RN96_9HEXA